MGTKAVFQVAVNESREVSPACRVHFRILGVTCDGFPPNLRVIAQWFMVKAKEMGVVDQVKAFDPAAINKVLRSVVDVAPDWIFTDIKGNERWVSYCATFHPDTNILEVVDSANRVIDRVCYV